MRDTLAEFGPVWGELFPREKARIARALIEKVEFNPEQGEIEIEFRAGSNDLIRTSNGH